MKKQIYIVRNIAVVLLLAVIFSFGFNLNHSSKKKIENTLKSASLSQVDGKFELDGVQFNYVRQGSGEPIVVIGSSVYYPKAFSNSLSDKYEMIFIDSRHFILDYNPSDEELDKLSFSTWADDLEAARAKLDLGKITVVGHSVHGQIALDYATRYPDSVTRLVIIGGVPYSFAELSEKSNDYWEKEADENRKATLKTRLLKQDSILQATPSNKKFSVGYDLNAPLYWFDPNYDASELLSHLLTSPKAFGKLISTVPSKQEVISKLKNLEVPSLVITGKYDFVCPHKAWEEIIQNTDVDYQLMNNASHNPQTEESTQQEFDRIFTSWISKNGG